MVNYIEAATAPAKNTGAIRIYGEDAFAGMR
jgi:methionyl aminopeptidase